MGPDGIWINLCVTRASRARLEGSPLVFFFFRRFFFFPHYFAGKLPLFQPDTNRSHNAIISNERPPECSRRRTVSKLRTYFPAFTRGTKTLSREYPYWRNGLREGSKEINETLEDCLSKIIPDDGSSWPWARPGHEFLSNLVIPFILVTLYVIRFNFSSTGHILSASQYKQRCVLTHT